MDWLQVMFLFFGNMGIMVGLIGWLRADIQESRKETKEFHGRLCVLEERYLNWVMRDK